MYVRSQRAGERVMAGLRRIYDTLKLTIHDAKSAVAKAGTRKFLGFSFYTAAGGEAKRRVARSATGLQDPHWPADTAQWWTQHRTGR